MLTASAVCDVLAEAFARGRVELALREMAAQGIVRPGSGAEFSPHNAIVAALAVALPPQPAGRALSAAMAMRDWLAQGLMAGWKLAPGTAIEDLKNIRLVRVMCSEVYTRQPGRWWISRDEIAGHGLRFWPAGGGERLVRPEPAWVVLPQSVMEGFARHHGLVSESQRRDNQQLLGRIARSIKLNDTTTMTGAERNRRHRAKLAEAETEAAE